MDAHETARAIASEFEAARFWEEPAHRPPGEFSNPGAHSLVWQYGMFETAAGSIIDAHYGFDRLRDTDAVEDRLTGALGAMLTAILDLPHDRIPWARNGYGPTFTALTIAAAECAANAVLCEQQWHGPELRAYYWFLQALPSVLPPTCASHVAAEKAYLDTVIDTHPALIPPAWLGTAPKPTGRVWTAADAYGDHLAVFIETRDPVHGTAAIYLAGLNAADGDYIECAHQYRTLDDAQLAWEYGLEDPQPGRTPTEVVSGEQIAFLSHLREPPFARRPETRALVGEYFRCQRRLTDAIAVLSEHGIDLPTRSADRDKERTKTASAFGTWLSEQQINADPHLVDALVTWWWNTAVPGTEHAVSPERINARLRPGNHDARRMPNVDGMLPLLQAWVGYCTARGQISAELADIALDRLTLAAEQFHLPQDRGFRGAPSA
jgi:hypothetical protein